MDLSGCVLCRTNMFPSSINDGRLMSPDPLGDPSGLGWVGDENFLSQESRLHLIKEFSHSVTQHYCVCFIDGEAGSMLQALHHNLFFILLGCSDYKPRPALQEVFSSRTERKHNLTVLTYPSEPGAKTRSPHLQASQMVQW